MTIKRALISVSDKNGLAGFAAGLHELGVELISTSGTESFLTDAGLPVTSVNRSGSLPAFCTARITAINS